MYAKSKGSAMEFPMSNEGWGTDYTYMRCFISSQLAGQLIHNSVVCKNQSWDENNSWS
jgi:hypothetical protein